MSCSSRTRFQKRLSTHLFVCTAYLWQSRQFCQLAEPHESLSFHSRPSAFANLSSLIKQGLLALAVLALSVFLSKGTKLFNPIGSLGIRSAKTSKAAVHSMVKATVSQKPNRTELKKSSQQDIDKKRRAGSQNSMNYYNETICADLITRTI